MCTHIQQKYYIVALCELVATTTNGSYVCTQRSYLNRTLYVAYIEGSRISSGRNVLHVLQTHLY